MLQVKKCGKSDYGYWVLGTLSYKGLELQDIFSVNEEVYPNTTYEVKNIIVKRNKKGNLNFKLEI